MTKEHRTKEVNQLAHICIHKYILVYIHIIDGRKKTFKQFNGKTQYNSSWPTKLVLYRFSISLFFCPASRSFYIY